jgi:hypothetical protein
LTHKAYFSIVVPWKSKFYQRLNSTMAIAEDMGKMVLTASGDEVGFVVFGA